MNFFTRGAPSTDDQENPTSLPLDTYHSLWALETVHANYAGMKKSLVDAGKFLAWIF